MTTPPPLCPWRYFRPQATPQDFNRPGHIFPLRYTVSFVGAPSFPARLLHFACPGRALSCRLSVAYFRTMSYRGLVRFSLCSPRITQRHFVVASHTHVFVLVAVVLCPAWRRA